MSRAFIAAVVVGTAYASGGWAGDARRFHEGYVIPDKNYCDQPYLVVTKNGNWLCTMTTGAGVEGERGQHVVAAISQDQGRTWSKLIDIEPADGPEASWVVPLITPSGRVYAFYTYNGDDVGHGNPQFALPDGKATYRADTVGWYCYRYSDDHGRTWSKKRYRLPMPVAACDRANQWKGRVQDFWGIDQPNIAEGTAVFAFTRLGQYMLGNGEGWLYRSRNVLSEPDADRMEWELLPEGDRGIRKKEFGSVQEEHNIVPLDGDALYCVYRTTKGFPCHTYSVDGGRTWTVPERMTYTPGGRVMRNPRACPAVWRTNEGRYLFWFHNNGHTTFSAAPGETYGSRNIVWLSGGKVINGRMHWSQPEVVRYCANPLQGCSYPSLLQDRGRYFIAATQKTEARIAEIDPQLLEDLWRQDELKTAVRKGMVLEHRATEPPAGETVELAMPRLPNLAEGGGLTIEMRLELPDDAPGRVLLDSRSPGGDGIVVATADGGNVQLNISDGQRSANWDCDPGLLKAGRLHHVVFIVDGGPKLISCVVDGQLCDGGDRSDRPWGYGRFLMSRYKSPHSDEKTESPELGDVTGGRVLRVAPSVRAVRLYDCYLRTSEAISNFLAG